MLLSIHFDKVTTLNKISNRSLFKLIISDKGLMTLKRNFVQSNGKKLSGLSEKLSFNYQFFWVKNAKIRCFEEKWFISEVLYQI